MKVSQIIGKDRLSLSYEVFPPRQQDASYDDIRHATRRIAALKPAFMSVTYGAGGGTGQFTLDIARDIMDQYNVPVMAHLTCVSSDNESVNRQIDAMKESGIENVMALRGDMPEELTKKGSDALTFRHAVELIRILKEKGDFCIGAACYPEVHPESANQKEDIKYLKEKVDAGVDFLTTQMVFDNNLFYNFLYKIREAGITVPVLPGIMPITNGNQIKRAIKLSGAFVPQRFKSIVDMFGTDPNAMKQAGIAYATDQIIDLYANGIRNVHVYSMNKPEVAIKIMNNLSDLLWKRF